jgi:spore maturation protein CgeB
MLSRLIGKIRGKLKSWRFHRFECRINPITIRTHNAIIDWANHTSSRRSPADENVETHDDVWQTATILRKETLNRFRQKYYHRDNLRILIHVPDPVTSPAGNFLFENLRQSIEFLGIATATLDWNDRDAAILNTFRPTVFLTSDHQSYLERIDWTKVNSYKTQHQLRIGLTASLQEYGNTPLYQRLEWAKRHNVDFFYSFRAPEYLLQRPEYGPFFQEGFEVLSVEFGANILRYYPEADTPRNLDYVFFGSVNPDKSNRYVQYFSRIFHQTSGYIEGVGWRELRAQSAPDVQRYIYARAKIGINLHLTEQIRWANELNERTYVLAACGVPQVVDNPALLPSRFSPESFFVASNPREYWRVFRDALADPAERKKRSLVALREVYSRHTTLHRAANLAESLQNIVDGF